jgi:hypothetical protein
LAHRLQQQRRQRQAALTFSSPLHKVRFLDPSPSSPIREKPLDRRFRFPFIEPTSFTIPVGDIEGWTLVQRRRWPLAPSSAFISSNPVNPQDSKKGYWAFS